MKKSLTQLLLTLAAALLSLAACVPSQPENTDLRTNFEALWTLIDERYCYLDEKGIDWDSIHTVYSQRLDRMIDRGATDDLTFFSLLAAMLDELKDGHVNLITGFDVSANSDWAGDPTEGLNVYTRKKAVPGYLMQSGGMLYNVFGVKGHDSHRIGYLRYNSFSSSLGNMEMILSYFDAAEGMILDIRGNGGGLVSNASKLAGYFYDERTLVGYVTHKVGPGRDNFSEPKAIYVTPAEGKRWTEKPLVILQDRGCYSAANDFLYKVSLAPNVYRIGLPSGGGGGMPATSELPNGWRVRYSAVKSLDIRMQSTECGIEPDTLVRNEAFDENPAAPDHILSEAILYIMMKDRIPADSTGVTN